MSDTTDYVPFLPPAPCGDTHVPTVTPKQEETLKEVFEHFSAADYGLPGEQNPELTEEEKFWLSHECMLRYLRAINWASPSAAIKRLEKTLKWRREYGIYDKITAEYIEPEQVTGKQFLFGYDAQNRPAYYMRPSRQNTKESPRQLEHAVWFLERAVDLMPAGVETIALMIDFADKGTTPSFNLSREYVRILQNHYPERLGRAMIMNVPFLVNALFSLIRPVLDPVTREKMKFNPQAIQDGLFTPDMLIVEWGGDRKLEYDHDQYFQSVVKMTTERKKNYMEKWRSLGGTVGLKEWEYKGGLGPSEKTVE